MSLRIVDSPASSPPPKVAATPIVPVRNPGFALDLDWVYLAFDVRDDRIVVGDRPGPSLDEGDDADAIRAVGSEAHERIRRR